MYILKGDHVDVVKYLLEHDAQVDQVVRYEWLVYHHDSFPDVIVITIFHPIKACTVDEAGIAPVDLTKSKEIKVIIVLFFFLYDCHFSNLKRSTVLYDLFIRIELYMYSLNPCCAIVSMAISLYLYHKKH